MSNTVDNLFEQYHLHVGLNDFELIPAKEALYQLILTEVIGEDEQAVIGRGVPGYTENLLRKRQRQTLAKLFGITEGEK